MVGGERRRGERRPWRAARKKGPKEEAKRVMEEEKREREGEGEGR